MSPEEKEIFLQMQQNINSILELIQTTHEPNNGYKIVLFLVPIFGIVFGSTLLCLIFLFWHRQRMELIKSGLYKPIAFDFRAYSFFLGLLLTFTGLTLAIVFIIVLGKSLAMLGGLIPLAIGLSLLTYYKFSR
ncbi:MAG TPA: hypothetical protein PK079_05645 [Leptospiraceae bacterium]|nr:hypothetical protein [Leptospiraceae bacterium]HMW05023.1 hypothetical protein [Leptospiraceae bacterium]HMX31467.1 hypothetical protein [Leptospiraceae bacterium]HMY33577.1 hypothetical protein [Leptospiraceae bacterium]HMZ62576.1 hypothetical protein [Leptospiraceae bacterium]